MCHTEDLGKSTSSMSAWGVGDIVAISKLAANVYTAYKDAPDDYKHVAEEINSLQAMINKAAQHFESTALGYIDWQEGQEAFKGCHSVLEDLNARIEEYNSLACTTSQVFKGVELDAKDIATLRARLIFNTGLLISFIQSCELGEIQAPGCALYNPGHGDCNNTLQPLPTKDASEAANVDNRAVHHAARNAHTGTVELPLMGGASTEVEDNDTPLHLVIRNKVLEAMCNGNNALLHFAARNGHTGMVARLLKNGASIEARDKCNFTPLHLAARRGQTSTVKLLLEKGAFVDATDQSNETPLHLAAQYGQTSTVKLLLEKGAFVDANNQFHQTPLLLAAGGHTSTAELLLENGASVDAPDVCRSVPLHYAARHGCASMVELLIRNGAQIEVCNAAYMFPLHYAEDGGHTDIVQLLKSKAAELVAHGNST